jgi:two-component system sensor kinase FixL
MKGCPRQELTVTAAAAPDGKAVISVADTGPGLAPQIREALFKPFVSSKSSGMGIGLSLSRTIVEAHGGSLWLEDNPSGGATFRFTLPNAPTPEPGEG